MRCHFNSKCKKLAEMVWSELESSKSYYVCIKHFKQLLNETPEKLNGFEKPKWRDEGETMINNNQKMKGEK